MVLQLDMSQPFGAKECSRALSDMGIEHDAFLDNPRVQEVQFRGKLTKHVYNIAFDHLPGDSMRGYANDHLPGGLRLARGSSNVETFYRIMRDVATFELTGQV